jgi:catechol 2,3-dioxygenase-like lactoylglutathione lyase family enzyme
MKLFGVRIFVDDYAQARAFYAETLGLPVAWEMPDLEAFGVEAGAAQIIVECEGPESPARAYVGRFAGVSLAVDEIAATYEDLKAKGVAFEGPPEKQPWGGTLAHFKDPAGNILTLLG